MAIPVLCMGRIVCLRVILLRNQPLKQMEDYRRDAASVHWRKLSVQARASGANR